MSYIGEFYTRQGLSFSVVRGEEEATYRVAVETFVSILYYFEEVLEHVFRIVGVSINFLQRSSRYPQGVPDMRGQMFAGPTIFVKVKDLQLVYPMAKVMVRLLEVRNHFKDFWLVQYERTTRAELYIPSNFVHSHAALDVATLVLHGLYLFRPVFGDTLVNGVWVSESPTSVTIRLTDFITRIATSTDRLEATPARATEVGTLLSDLLV